MMLRYSAGRASSPAGRLAEVLSEPPADPLTPEWLAVPSDGAVALITSVQTRGNTRSQFLRALHPMSRFVER
jgi:hypothetical protein